jgi:hypothetical protein
MGVLIGLIIGLTVRLLVWAARAGYRLVAHHPVLAVLALLVAKAEGWVGGQLFGWALLGLTLWAVLSILSARFPARRPAATATLSRVSYAGGPWQRIEHRDVLDHVSVRDRNRFERARRRQDRQLADAGIGNGRRARRRRRGRGRP